MTRPEGLLAVAAVLALAVLARVALVGRRRSSAVTAIELCRAFGLDPARYRVLGADVGGFRVPFEVRADGLIGRPDAVFRAKDGDEVVVGEVKSRRHRGRITRYERYQITLYQGAVRAQLRTATVRGRIRYRDGVVEAPFCAHTYRQLLSLKSEYRQARAATAMATVGMSRRWSHGESRHRAAGDGDHDPRRWSVPRSARTSTPPPRPSPTPNPTDR